MNSADSGYANPHYIEPLMGKCDNLNLVIRLRAGMKVYRPYQGEQKEREKVYDNVPYYLQYEREKTYIHPKTKVPYQKAQTSIFDLKVDETYEFETQTRKGRKLKIVLSRWNNLLLRGTREHKMDNHSFDLVAVNCVDNQTGELLFNRPMFLSFWEKIEQPINCNILKNDYRHRYDNLSRNLGIEVHNRFSKQQLLMDKYQTLEVSHLDAWNWIVQLTYWLLYSASTEVDIHVNKWEKYLPEVKRAQKSTTPKSVAMTRKGAKALFSTFDLTAFKPQTSKNGAGRKKGQKMPKLRWERPQKKKQIKLS